MKPPQPIRLNLVIDTLVDTFASIDGVTVLDGPVASPGSTAGDYLQVGQPGEESALTTVEPQAGLRTVYVETDRVVCVAWSWSGSKTMKPRRDRCAAILTAVDAVLRADPTLGGVVDRALLGPDWALQQDLTDSGSIVSIGFTVDVRSII